jgi:hypothetical protein
MQPLLSSPCCATGYCAAPCPGLGSRNICPPLIVIAVHAAKEDARLDRLLSNRIEQRFLASAEPFHKGVTEVTDPEPESGIS